MTRIDEIQERCEKATAGPWNLHEREITALPGFFPILIAKTAQGARGIPDAAFIAHAREDTPWLIDAIREKDEEIAGLEQAIETRDRMLAEYAADRDRWKARAEALEKVVQGRCFTCALAKPPKINTMSGFPNMSICEYRKGVLAGTSVNQCEYWRFDQTRFTGGAQAVTGAEERSDNE